MTTRESKATFGRVFVPVNDCNPNTTGYKVLEGANFCKLQLNVFRENGDDKSLFGKRYSVDLFGHRIRMPIPLGMNPVTPPESLEYALTSFVKFCEEIGLDVGENGKMSTDRYEALKRCSLHLIAAVSVGEFSREKLDFMCPFLCYAFVDDLLEAIAEHDNQPMDLKKFSFNYLSQLANAVYSALETNDEKQQLIFFEQAERKHDNNQSVVNNVDTSAKLITYEKYALRAFKAVCKQVHNLGKHFGCSTKPFFLHYGKWTQFVLFDTSREWRLGVMGGELAEKMLPLLARVRAGSNGGDSFLEGLLLQDNFQIDDSVRQTAVFKMIQDLVGVHAQKMQDFYSLRKELIEEANEWRRNEAGILHKVKGLSMHDALGKLLDDANQALAEVEVLFTLLQNTWPPHQKEHEQANNFIWEAKRAISIFNTAMSLAGRYHENCVLDCYVDS